ncbi:D-xylose reductase [Microsporum canis]|uniref:Probable NAD(P)H-dependent D-xylose reductase xyl1 n=1 Tax=Arthroderma otae (strain ATCC MYA-4605 / CBS 113480) TaxID=554155 RepID=XYL1_ARTOC|nr:NAD(P)H-dependent D-xylose reductase [Microsporum canis CBS 113480]C5FFQ7.1 RecName: Full=Probable NAD(P)H-dependent D-xylose reductase xyl1; Short=XR [Microsporum canis CBS 113480]EEQ29592.1 NAD(P)H-dependent D-xylose reductase [Microsporum canis CBS 113480]
MASTTPNLTAPAVKLNSGYAMPIVGFGLWKVNKETCADQVYNAIRTGYRLFDGACDYGNEVEAGKGVARAIKEGIVRREDLFIVSKLWGTFHDPEHVEPACRRQLSHWGIDYFDLFIVHFPISLKYVDPEVRYPPEWSAPGEKAESGNVPLYKTWGAMEELVDKRLARSIGISNFSPQLIMDLLRYARIRPSTLQIEHHPYLTQEGLIKYAQDEGLVVTAYSSLGPQSFIELENKAATGTTLLLEHPTIKSSAEKHGKTPAQILLRWATQRGIAVIPKSNNPDRLAQNLDATGFNLTANELRAISALDQGLRFNNPPSYGVNFPIFG